MKEMANRSEYAQKRPFDIGQSADETAHPPQGEPYEGCFHDCLLVLGLYRAENKFLRRCDFMGMPERELAMYRFVKCQKCNSIFAWEQSILHEVLKKHLKELTTQKTFYQ